jgi:hypothetical protein
MRYSRPGLLVLVCLLVSPFLSAQQSTTAPPILQQALTNCLHVCHESSALLG